MPQPFPARICPAHGQGRSSREKAAASPSVATGQVGDGRRRRRGPRLQGPRPRRSISCAMRSLRRDRSRSGHSRGELVGRPTLTVAAAAPPRDRRPGGRQRPAVAGPAGHGRQRTRRGEAGRALRPWCRGRQPLPTAHRRPQAPAHPTDRGSPTTTCSTRWLMAVDRLGQAPGRRSSSATSCSCSGSGSRPGRPPPGQPPIGPPHRIRPAQFGLQPHHPPVQLLGHRVGGHRLLQRGKRPLLVADPVAQLGQPGQRIHRPPPHSSRGTSTQA